MKGGKRDSRKPGKPLEHATPGSPKTDPVIYKPPLQPHKTLFIGLLAVFAIWVAALVGIYVKTVYKPRHAPGPPTRVFK